MQKLLGLMALLILIVLVGCQAQIGDYTPAAAISRDGFAIDGDKARASQGQTVKLWGYVDPGNLYGDESARAILGEWWGGDGPTAATWRFNLKARENDPVGHSFAVHVPNDSGRDDLLRAFVTDARAGRPTRVFVTGRLFTFDAPANFASLTGLYLELDSSCDVLLEPPRQ